MKKTILFTITAFAIIATCLIGCEGQSGLSTPSNFKAYQEGNTIVLSWDKVSGASYYEINKNGSFWQSTSDTRIVDKKPEEGINSYELIASNGEKQSKPAKASCDFESSNPGGGGGGELTSTDFYIKHPWGSGSDDSWSWKPMTKSGNSYTYTGLWGGVGANINTTADDSGAEWYEASKINGASSLSVGTQVTFTFVSTNGNKGTLSVSASTGGGTETGSLPAPTGLTLSQTSSYIKLSWNKVSGAAGYYIAKATADSEWEYYQATSTSAQFDDVIAGTTYVFSVAAYDSEENPGEWSEDKYITFNGSSSGGGGSTTSKPSTPTGVNATAASSYIVVTWNSVSGAESYNVYRSTSASGSYTLQSSVTTTNYTDYNVNAGTTYYYKVEAENSAGKSSKSSYASAKISTSGGGGTGGGTTSKPSTPTGLHATAGSSSITLSWNSVSGATSYYVWRNTSASGTYSYLTEVYSTSYTDSYVTSGTTYYYKVCAVNSAGQSAQSSYVSATISSGGGGSQGGGTSQNYAPCEPNVTCKAGLFQAVSVSWKASTGSGCGTPTSYTIKRYNPLNGANEVIESNYTATYLTDSEPFPGSNTYMVIANNNYGSSNPSYGYATVEMDAPDIYSVFGNGDEINVAVKRPKMPEEREGYYYLEFQSSASYSGSYESEGEFNFYEGLTTHEQVGNNIIDHYVIYFTPSYAGQTRYFKFRWVFKGGGINEKGKFTTPQSVRF